MQLYVVDDYPSEQFYFWGQGFRVAIKDEKLADVLNALPNEKRNIVLLANFLNITDQEIADRLNTVRRTVQYKRTSFLKEMKRRLKVEEDGKQSE